MSYEPTIWKKGDKVTSTKLNKIENGIQGNDEEITSIKEGLSELPKVATPEDAAEADLYICDAQGNALVQFADGNIETKNFRGFKYIAFSVSDRFVPNVTKKVSVSYPFRKGDRVVFHVERSSYPYNAP